MIILDRLTLVTLSVVEPKQAIYSFTVLHPEGGHMLSLYGGCSSGLRVA